MSPRRSGAETTLAPRRLRRGRDTGGTGTKLVVGTSPPAVFQSGIAAGGCSVRLQTAQGQNILLAGVPVTISLLQSTVGTVLTAVPGPVVNTDVSGVATWTSLTLTGTGAVTYGLLFSAPGYLSVSTSGHAIIAGTVTAASSTMTVPDGSVGQTTTIDIQLRDEQSNQSLVAAPSPVTIQITGSNPVPLTTVPFNAAIPGYRFTYVPSVAGLDQVTGRYGGTPITGSPFPSSVSDVTGGFTANSLRVALTGMINDVFGTGPAVSAGAWTTAEPIFRVAQGSHTPSSLTTKVTSANALGILLLPAMPGSRASYTDTVGGCLIYNRTKFQNAVDTYNNSTITDACRRRRIIWYMFDEPWIDQFCGTLTPYEVKLGFQYVKSAFPDSLIAARIEPQYLRGGWGSAVTMPDGVNARNLPVNYFDKLDYAWATFRGNRDPSTGMTPLQFYTWGYNTNLAAGYGTIFGANWLNLADATDCWDAFNTGSSSGHIHGDDSSLGLEGVIENCGVNNSDTRWAQSPARIVECAQAAANPAFADVPLLLSYYHPGSGTLINSVFIGIMQRADYVTGWTLAVRTGESRATPFAWRTPK